MDNSLKQRIVGAIVLIALAVIFLPPLLKKERTHREFESRIPPKPSQIAVLSEPDLKSAADEVQSTAEMGVVPGSSSSKAALPDVDGSDTKERTIKNSEKTANNSGQSTRKTPTKKPSTQSSVPSKKQPGLQTGVVVGQGQSSDGANKAHSMNDQENAERDTLSDKYQSAAWVIQVASFSDKSNAQRLVKKLKKAGFKAYRRDKLSQGKRLSRVYVGPYIKKSKANQDLPGINKQAAVKAFVKVYDPIKD